MRYFERNEVYDVNPLSPLDPRFGNCATTLYRQDFSDQLIKERTGHRSLEAIHKYKRTGPDQQYKVSMALLPQIDGKENKKLYGCRNCMDANDDDDEFIPMKKKPKIKPERPQSHV